MTVADVEMYFKDRSTSHLIRLHDELKYMQKLGDVNMENHILETCE